MFVKLSEYYYTNKFIPISTDSTILKIVKVSGIVFFGLFAFLFDCGLKLLADRNIKQQKEDLLDLAAFLKNTLGSIESTRDMQAIIESAPTEIHENQESLVVEKNASLDAKVSPLAESTENILVSTATPAMLPVIEKIPIEMPTDKYSMSLVAQKKALEKYLSENFPVDFNFQVISEAFLENLQLFVVGKPIDSKFAPIFGKSSLLIHKHLVSVIDKLLKEHSSNEPSKDYEEYTHALRDAISTKEYKNNKYEKLSCLIQELCFAKFIYTVLTDLEEKILKNTIGFDSSRNMTSSNISKLIKEDNKILSKQRKTVRQSILLNCEKACNAAGLNSDQLCSANIPELRSIHRVKQVDEPYDVYYIRYPTPTIETKQSFLARFKGGNATAIALEFIGFLDCLQRKEIPFLHVNHQYMDKKKNNDSVLSADNNRAEAIQKLEETHDKVFYFLSLPFDGPVVSKISKENLESWKENLVNNVIREKDGFKVPKKFRESAARKKEKLEKEIRQLLDDLHSLYFPKKQEPKLNETERRVLLVIFYSYLKEYFKADYHICIMASVCKDNKDRGNMSACIDEALFNLRLGKENDQQALKDLHLRALGPFIFREEGIVPDRLQFLTDLLDHIAELDGDQKEKIRAFQVKEGYQITDQNVPRSNDEIKDLTYQLFF